MDEDAQTATSEADALGCFGALMLDAGYAVTDVAQSLRETAAAAGGSRDVVIGVLPQAVLIDVATPADAGARGEATPRARAGTAGPVASGGLVAPLRGARLVQAGGESLTFDQVGRTGRLVADAARGLIPWRQLPQRVAAIRADPRLRPAWVVVLGSGLMSCGVAVVFGARWWSLAADALLGLLVGALIVGASRWLRVAQLLPFLCAVATTVLLLVAADLAGADRVPLFAACAPLVILIPGAIVTNAVIELSAGDVVSGGGRLISGLVVWGLLAAGIAAGAAIVGARIDGAGIQLASASGSADALWGAAVPDVLAWPATALVAVGVGLFGSASSRLTAAIVAVLLLTYGLFVGLQPVAGTVVATGAAAGIVLAATRALEAAAPDYPSIVVFRPAYWLLVPGSFGLVALTGGGDSDPVRATIGTILALTVGTQIGAIVAEACAALPRAVRRRREDARTSTGR